MPHFMQATFGYVYYCCYMLTEYGKLFHVLTEK